jgi:hypothetical protein
MIFALSVFVLTVVGSIIGIITLPFHAIGNTIDTGHEVIDKTINADNALYNYEWFKQTHEDIKAIENKVSISQQSLDLHKNTYGDPVNWSFSVSEEYSRLSATKQGQMSQLEDVIATYNARAKMANRNIFQDGLIPSALEIGSNLLK